MKKTIIGLLLLGSMSAWAADGLGTCVAFKKTDDGTNVSKTFIHSTTREACDALRGSYDDVQFSVGNLHTLGSCNSYACSFPCIDHFGCTCATGDCH